MDIGAMITAVVVIGAIGLIIGLFLGISAKKLKVETDPKEEEILGTLPGNNCGGCGYAGCAALAGAIAKGDAAVNACPVGGKKVGDAIASIMGIEAMDSIRMTAWVKCAGDCEKTTKDYEYQGVEDCRMLSFVPNGGPKSCNFGCLGYGTCVKECPFDAIYIVNGVAVVDPNKCKACGKCVVICPKHIIEMVPYDAKYLVACSSKDRGPVVMKECQVGCIGCGICKKNCSSDAIKVEENLAHIDYDKCTKCGACYEKCPKKTIKKISKNI